VGNRGDRISARFERAYGRDSLSLADIVSIQRLENLESVHIARKVPRRRRHHMWNPLASRSLGVGLLRHRKDV